MDKNRGTFLILWQYYEGEIPTYLPSAHPITLSLPVDFVKNLRRSSELGQLDLWDVEKMLAARLLPANITIKKVDITEKVNNLKQDSWRGHGQF